MKQLSEEQRKLVSLLTDRLAAVAGMKGVVLAGSYARGHAQPGSDIDLGLFYSEAAPFSIDDIRQIAESTNDTPAPVVTDFYGWGPWVNGGAWLIIRGQRVDFIYRSLEHVERVIADAERGRYEIDYAQQPPFGFFGPTYLGEIGICIPLADPECRVDTLKRRVANYPEALRRALVQDCLWQAEFNLACFAKKFAARGDTYGTGSCLTRAVNNLVLALFALNRKYPINDKTSLVEIAQFERSPARFVPRVQQTLARIGSSTDEATAAVNLIAEALRDTIAIAGELYRPLFPLPK